MVLTYLLYIFRIDQLESLRAQQGPNTNLNNINQQNLDDLTKRNMATSYNYRGNPENFKDILNIKTCSKPSTLNPFMNPLVFDSRLRDSACDSIKEENQLQMIGLSEECLEKTRNIVISMVSGEVPDKKYAILDVSYEGFYMPTDWMRQQICTSHDIHDTFIRIDEKDFRFALNVKSKVRPFSEEDYYIKFLNSETIMEDIYNKMCADMPPEINLLSEQFFTLKQKYPDAKPIDVVSVFYLFISYCVK